MKKLLTAALIALACSFGTPSFAQLPGQTVQTPQYTGASGAQAPAQGVAVISYDSVTGLPCIAGSTATCKQQISGSFSAAPFAATGGAVKLTSGSSASANIALTAPGPNELIYNSGAVPVWVSFGSSGAVTAAVGTLYYVPPGQSIPAAGGAATWVAAYGVGGVSDVYVTPGTGSPTGWGGGGGGGGAVTVASGADVIEGATTDTASTNTVLGNLQAIKAAAQDTTTPQPVKVDHTTPGVTDAFVVSNLARTISAAPTGGATPFHLVTTSTTNATLVSAGAHTLYALSLTGVNTTIGWLRAYDSATTPTCSSTTAAVHSWPVIGSATQQGGLTIPLPAQGEAYLNGLGFCFTGGGGDADNTPGPAGVAINGSYK